MTNDSIIQQLDRLAKEIPNGRVEVRIIKRAQGEPQDINGTTWMASFWTGDDTSVHSHSSIGLDSSVDFAVNQFYRLKQERKERIAALRCELAELEQKEAV